ncbi:hypothetical protein [Streptomyces sp. 3N207]|uniref:hypothetical protein n=1 Tax=Streptomyces sp. 3N207 TaxID=3457417 RepID=UPI003FD437AF
MAFRRSEKPEAVPQQLLWNANAVATRPTRFMGAQRRTGWVLYRWDTQLGEVVLAHTVRGEMGTTFPGHALLRELADDAVALAVVEPDYNIPHGPSLEAIDAAGPDEYYGTTWRRLEQLLGMPAPYWHGNLRDPELMMAWRPGAATVTVPAVVVPDPAPLLRLAAQEPDGSHAAVAALALAREAVWDSAEDARREINEHVDTSDSTPRSRLPPARSCHPRRSRSPKRSCATDGRRSCPAPTHSPPNAPTSGTCWATPRTSPARARSPWTRIPARRLGSGYPGSCPRLAPRSPSTSATNR